MSLSIIIPHYNNSERLEILLMSIPQNKKIQVIIIDDQSDLHHLKKIDLLQVKYTFEYYQNKKAKSAGSCRNIGLKKATGDWLLFADSDDYFIESFYDVVSKYFDSKNDVVFFKPTSIDINTRKTSDRHLYLLPLIDNYLASKEKDNEMNLRYKFHAPWSKIIKKKLIDNYKITFDEIIFGNDVMFSTKIGHFLKICDASCETIYCVTKRDKSLTSDISENAFDSRLDVFFQYYKFLKKKLNQKQLELINPISIGRYYIIISLKRFGFKKFLKVNHMFKKENIRWFSIFSFIYKILQFFYYQLRKSIKYLKS